MFVKGLMTPEKIAFCESVTFDETIKVRVLHFYGPQCSHASGAGTDTSMSYAARTCCIHSVIHNFKAIKNHLVVDSDSGGILGS
jgi:hypothetical protein